MSSILNARSFKAGWILIGCQCVYHSSAGKKNVLKVIPAILFLCAVVMVWGLDSAIRLYLEHYQNGQPIFIVIAIVVVLGVKGQLTGALNRLTNHEIY